MKRQKEIERVRKAQEKMARRHGKIPKEPASEAPPETEEPEQAPETGDEAGALLHH